MSGTSVRGRARHRRRRGIASRPTARRRIRRAISRATPAGCTRTAMPASAHWRARGRSARSLAWPMCGASSSTSTPLRARRSAAEALERIAALYAIEKEVRGQPPERRVAIRRAKAAPHLDEFERWLQTQLPKLSAKTPLAAAIRHALTRLKRQRGPISSTASWNRQQPGRARDAPDRLGPEELSLHGCSASGGRAAAIAYTLIETARLNHVDPQAWLAQVLERHPRLQDQPRRLLPWNYTPNADQGQIA